MIQKSKLCPTLVDGRRESMFKILMVTKIYLAQRIMIPTSLTAPAIHLRE